MKDEEGHGTEVIEIIIDTAKHKNFCVVVLKFWNRGLSTQQTIQATISAYQKAKELGVKLINYSATGNTASPEEAFFIKKNPNITFVVAAGNENVNLDVSPRYPASYGFSNILVVGALTPSGTKLRISNYGDTVKYWEVGSATSFSTPVKTGKLINERFAR